MFKKIRNRGKWIRSEYAFEFYLRKTAESYLPVGFVLENIVACFVFSEIPFYLNEMRTSDEWYEFEYVFECACYRAQTYRPVGFNQIKLLLFVCQEKNGLFFKKLQGMKKTTIPWGSNL